MKNQKKLFNFSEYIELALRSPSASQCKARQINRMEYMSRKKNLALTLRVIEVTDENTDAPNKIICSVSDGKGKNYFSKIFVIVDIRKSLENPISPAVSKLSEIYTHVRNNWDNNFKIKNISLYAKIY